MAWGAENLDPNVADAAHGFRRLFVVEDFSVFNIKVKLLHWRAFQTENDQ
jgi:hypothetical protein